MCGELVLIYVKESGNKLEQGDILTHLPKINYNQIENWDAYFTSFSLDSIPEKPIKFEILPTPTSGVILSQTCDLKSGFHVLFAEIRPRNISTNKMDKKIHEIRKIIRDETRSYYLPIDESIDLLKTINIIDFKSLFIVPFDKIMNNNVANFFVARLMSPAQKVLQDKISRFFTRLAFDDFIFLNDDEIIYYSKSDSQDEKNEIINTLSQLGRPTENLSKKFNENSS